MEVFECMEPNDNKYNNLVKKYNELVTKFNQMIETDNMISDINNISINNTVNNTVNKGSRIVNSNVSHTNQPSQNQMNTRIMNTPSVPTSQSGVSSNQYLDSIIDNLSSRGEFRDLEQIIDYMGLSE